MQAVPNPLPQTENALAWLTASRDQMMTGALVALGLVGLMLIARAVGERMVARESDGALIGWRTVIGRVLARTGILFMIVTAVEIVTSYAVPPPRIQRLTDIAFIIAVALQGAIWARELILAIIARRVGENPGETTLGNATAIIRVLVSVALFALAIIVILDNLGVNVTALIAGFGIGGIAIGLAAQGIFADLFAALAIVFDKPFRRGDTVRYGTTVGTVERIGLKTTRLRAVSGELLIMSNTKLLDQELINVAEARTRRTWLPFGVIYQTSPDVIDALPALMVEVLKPLKTCRVVRCCATALGDSAIDCELVYDDRSSDADTLAKHKSAIILGILRAFARDGIQVAYPTQTTFTSAPDGTMIMPYPAVQPVTTVVPKREPDDDS